MHLHTPVSDTAMCIQRSGPRLWQNRGMRTALLVVLVLLAGCGNPPEAPRELSELLRYMLREWENEDPAVLEAGAANLAEYLAGVDYDGDRVARSTEPGPITEDDVADMGHAEGTEPGDTVNLSLAWRSPHAIDLHGLWQAEVDHTPAEPSANEYVRSFDDGGDGTCFADRGCDPLFTSNVIERGNVLFTVEFDLDKHFRWVRIDDDRWMIVARAWFDEIYPASQGTAVLRQSYTLDVWADNGLGGSDRIQVLYSETAFDPPIDEDIKRNTTRLSIDGAMEATDEAITELLLD